MDELSISPDLTFSSETLQFEGICHHGKDETNSSLQLADHALVLMFRPYRGSWVQPFAVYAAKDAMPGEQLADIVKKAVVTLENVGAKVCNITCDGASSNRTMARLLGVNGHNNESFVNYMVNPVDPDRKIWFFWDPPHAFKCIRNHWFNVKIIQVI